MFPYPSRQDTSVILGIYIASDIYSRTNGSEGFNVLHPMG